MHIGIVGAGFTGLSAALRLQKAGHNVTVFEKEAIPGGLAIGFRAKEWEWSLEKHYHHIFTTDNSIREVADEVGAQFDFSYPNTSWLIDDDMCRIDSGSRLLQFQKLSLIDRLRMGSVLAFFKLTTNWKPFESVTAHEWLPKVMGEKVYKMFWEPLLIAKFGEYAHSISLTWFWARIKARSSSLGYPKGGFQELANKMAQAVETNGGIIHFHTTIETLKQSKDKVQIFYTQGEQKNMTFDNVIVTLPNFFFEKMAPQLPTDYKKRLLSFKGIGAVNMVLELKEKFFKDDTYWLSICSQKYPFLAVVEHTNFVDKKHYNNNHLLYVGNYVPATHPYQKMTQEELLKIYDPFLKKFNPRYQDNLINSYIFKVPFAQPIIPINYSQKIMPFETPISHVYLSNMQQVYPWDRGTNYAVEFGQKVADLIISQ